MSNASKPKYLDPSLPADEVFFTFKFEQFAAFHDEDGRPFVEPGTFQISVGGGQPIDHASHAISTSFVVSMSPCVK